MTEALGQALRDPQESAGKFASTEAPADTVGREALAMATNCTLTLREVGERFGLDERDVLARVAAGEPLTLVKGRSQGFPAWLFRRGSDLPGPEPVDFGTTRVQTRLAVGLIPGRLSFAAMAARRTRVLVGRGGERQVLDRLVTTVRGGQSAALVMELRFAGLHQLCAPMRTLPPRGAQAAPRSDQRRLP